ncbi:MAG: hypothetical protein U0165_13315 [Polyangiaceae bacterium]
MASSTQPENNASDGARQGSWIAVVPLAAWTLCHLLSNLAAFKSAQSWSTVVTWPTQPTVGVAASALVLLTLLFHTGTGLARLSEAIHEPTEGSPWATRRARLKWASALAVLCFLGAHIWLDFLYPRLVEGHAKRFYELAAQMRHGALTLPVFALGTLALSYHLALGLDGFARARGLRASHDETKPSGKLFVAVFVLLLTMSWGTIFALWRAGGAFAG